MNTTGQLLRLSVFGESHGPVIGGVLDGVPAGMPIHAEVIQRRMDERRPGTSKQVSARDEADAVEILSGVHEGRATGAPLAFLIRNQDVRSQDYDALRNIPRPGHADLSEHWWSHGHNDPRGGGHRSGRLTAPMVAAAALVAPLLEAHGIQASAELVQAGDAANDAEAMAAAIETARANQDSIGGLVRFEATRVPSVLGDPMMDGMGSRLGQLLFAIPAVKGVSFGAGFEAVAMNGSDHNDGYRMDGDRIRFETNHAGGVLGGRTTGQPLWGHVAFKPASSIAQSQHSVDLEAGTDVDVAVKGRHDPCIAVRGVPVVRACLELALADFLLLAAAQGHVDALPW